MRKPISKKWDGIPKALRQRAFFSSRSESARFLKRARTQIKKFLEGGEPAAGTTAPHPKPKAPQGPSQKPVLDHGPKSKAGSAPPHSGKTKPHTSPVGARKTSLQRSRLATVHSAPDNAPTHQQRREFLLQLLQFDAPRGLRGQSKSSANTESPRRVKRIVGLKPSTQWVVPSGP